MRGRKDGCGQKRSDETRSDETRSEVWQPERYSKERPPLGTRATARDAGACGRDAPQGARHVDGGGEADDVGDLAFAAAIGAVGVLSRRAVALRQP